MAEITAEVRGRAFRQAAAFLLHWQDPLSGGEGEAEVLSELDFTDEQVPFACALARLTWQMAMAADLGGIEEAAKYLRDTAAAAALDEASGASDA